MQDSTCIEIVQLARVVQGVAAGGGSRGKGGQSVLLFASPGVCSTQLCLPSLLLSNQFPSHNSHAKLCAIPFTLLKP